MIILGIETSCDETGVGIVEVADLEHNSTHIDGQVRVLADQVASSVDQHARFGGVVPEIASRAHLEAIGPTMRRALQEANVSRPDAVAVTIGPGLAGALLVGVAAAKAYAAAWDVPLYAVNHLAAHVAVDTVEHGPLPPSIALLVSGGHTHLLYVPCLSEPLVELGSTIDDAAGEAFDKVARLLDLGYPGGPMLDQIAQQGDATAITFPRGMTGPRDAKYDFSFSGLKTAVARYVEQHECISIPDVAASFQEAVADVLILKAMRAVEDRGVDTLVLGGGATANSRIRSLAAARCAQAGVALRVPSPALCTDNGVMVAALAAHLIMGGAEPSALCVVSDPGLNVTETQKK